MVWLRELCGPWESTRVPRMCGCVLKYFSQHRARAAADVDHGPNGIPAPSNLKFGIWSSVSLWSDKGRRVGGDLGMGIEILQTVVKHLLVGTPRRTGGGCSRHRPSGRRFLQDPGPSAARDRGDLARVHGEWARRGSFENASAYQVPEHAV